MPDYKLRINKKIGATTIITIFFSCCLLILLIAMTFRQSNAVSHNKLLIEDRQAHFAARAAMQHFLLKSKLLPAELYDAVQIAQGKNPRFDFSEFEEVTQSGELAFKQMNNRSDVYIRVVPEKELDEKQQSKYFYHLIPDKKVFIRLGSYYNPNYRFLASDLIDSKYDDKYLNALKLPDSAKADKYLNYYIRDCTNMTYIHLQPTLEFNTCTSIKKSQDWDISTMNDYPYSMSYRVTNIETIPVQKQDRYGEEAIEIYVEGIVKTSHGKLISQAHKRVQKVTRQGMFN